MKELYIKENGNKPIVSVVISLYNYRDFITRALNSLFQQTLEEIEIIICDDCSQDDSLDVVEKWFQAHQTRFCRLVLIQNDVNSKLPATRNHAITYATAPYIFILDADNYIFPACLERSVKVLQDSAKDVAFVYAERLVFNEENPKECRLENLPDWNFPLLTVGNYIDVMVLHKAEALRHIGAFSEEFQIAFEDYEMWFKYHKHGMRGIKIHQPLIAYSFHEDSMSHTSHYVSNLLNVTRDIAKKYPEYYDPLPLT